MKISLKQMRFFAHHGVMPEETLIGGNYEVNLTVELLNETSTHTDALADTLNYQLLYDAVKEEMATNSQLIEHVAGRICDRVKQDFPQITKVDVSVKKFAPPIGGDVACAEVELEG